jgi:hypothetical protein
MANAPLGAFVERILQRFCENRHAPRPSAMSLAQSCMAGVSDSEKNENFASRRLFFARDDFRV